MNDKENKHVILIVDDEPSIVNSLTRMLEEEYTCLGAPNAAEARKAFSGRKITCVLSDQRMPGESGSDFLAWVKEAHPETTRILITGYSEFESVVSAVNQGHIFHFLQKPWEPIQLEVLLRQVVEHHRLSEENKSLHEELKRRNQLLERENIHLKNDTILENELFRNLVGFSEPMQRLKKKLLNLLPSQSTVLINGESGTGKELVAKALHFAGPRKDKPFVAQNCAAVPDSILESELFGYVKGAFTHAVENRLGIVESAQGGTLFLDEVGDMSLSMQAKLLRFLQEGIIMQVGGRVERRVDVRIITATHRDLEAMVKDKTFREDLYYRLNVIPVRTPALRERRDDIPVLAEHFLQKKSVKMKKTAPHFSPEALEVLKCHNFPGNVRELENAVEYALNVVGDRAFIAVDDLPDRIQSQSGPTHDAREMRAAPTQSFGNLPSELLLEQAVVALEIEWVERAMKNTGGNISQAAKLLGLSRQGLHNKLAKYGIKE